MPKINIRTVPSGTNVKRGDFVLLGGELYIISRSQDGWRLICLNDGLQRSSPKDNLSDLMDEIQSDDRFGRVIPSANITIKES